MKIRIWPFALIVAGILIFFYPKLSETYDNYQQQKLIQEWQASFQNIDLDEPDQDGTEEQADAPVESDPAPEAPPGNAEKDDRLEGMLHIEKIDLNLPILHGATQENMKTTLASIDNTGQAGQIGNYAIAGHRNRTYGRNFNRLDEMEEGDTIEVDNGEDKYTYTVVEKLYVKPDEVWVLEGNGKDKEITLVTCHPMGKSTHRLIIKGKMIEDSSAAS